MSKSTLKPGIGVYGSVFTGSGVVGSTSNVGIDGEANGTGVSGVAANDGNANTGIGVYGESDSCDAYADCGLGIGIFGRGHSIGVEAVGSSYGTALVGYNSRTPDSGLHTPAASFAAGTADGVGVTADAANIGVAASSPSTGYGFASVNNQTNVTVFSVDGNGNVSYAGSLKSDIRTTVGVHVASYGARSSAPTLEDNSSAELVAGTAVVRLDPIFAAAIDPRVAYHVTVTADGDTRGLYVTAKTPTGFTVRESQGGRSTVSFDYRVVAAANGAAGMRMSAMAQPLGPHSISAASLVRSALRNQPKMQKVSPIPPPSN